MLGQWVYLALRCRSKSSQNQNLLLDFLKQLHMQLITLHRLLLIQYISFQLHFNGLYFMSFGVDMLLLLFGFIVSLLQLFGLFLDIFLLMLDLQHLHLDTF